MLLKITFAKNWTSSLASVSADLTQRVLVILPELTATNSFYAKILTLSIQMNFNSSSKTSAAKVFKIMAVQPQQFTHVLQFNPIRDARIFALHTDTVRRPHLIKLTSQRTSTSTCEILS